MAHNQRLEDRIRELCALAISTPEFPELNAILKKLQVEKLREIPGLHREERQAIEDALSGLRMLEQEEVQYTSQQQRKVAHDALEKLRTISPKIERLESQQTDDG